MKDLTAQKGRYYIEDLVAQGEHEQQDFKFMISDARKIARSISAFANRGGGRLLIGVKDNGTLAGVRNEEDIYVVEQAAASYCRPAQHVEFTAFNVGGGTLIIRAAIAAATSRPVFAMDTDRRWKVYYRVADENIVAHPLMVKAWQLREAEAGEASLFSLSSVESRLLGYLDACESPVTPRDIALTLHITGESADELIVRLASMGIIEFVYSGKSEFRIRRTH
ncbi:MAG: putative DNA binding domain-containing protein [Muribaculaceae bacterium]|nr:putative DNA binding domain-containing protein [Muribaculaceae bacterium]